MAIELGYCQCGTDLRNTSLRELPDGGHGKACPECGTDVYCGECGDMTYRNPPTDNE